MTCWLHYIGSRLYGIERFRREALKLGANRAVPPNILKAMRWGDVVYCAVYDSKERKATVFGYFMIDKVHVTGLPDEAWQELVVRVRVVSVSTRGYYVERYCGGYYVAGHIVVEDDIADFVEKVLELAEKYRVRPKFFVGGRYWDLPQPSVVQPAKFTRSYMRVPCSAMPEARPHRHVVRVEDYRQRRSISKRELAALESAKITDFL